MSCILCGSNQVSSFNHSVFSDDIFVSNNKVENVECFGCDVCGTLKINRIDLYYKALERMAT